MKQKHHILAYTLILLMLVIVLLFLMGSGYLGKLDLSPDKIKDNLLAFGAFAPIMLIAIQFLLAIISILPSPLFSIAGGYLFGPFYGALYSLIGMMLGSVVVFAVARKLGRPFAEKLVDKKELRHFDIFFKKKGALVFIFADYLSVFPRDTVSLCAGLTKIKKSGFIMASLIGFIPPLILLNYFGSQLSRDIFDVRMVLIAAIMLSSFVMYLFRHQIKGLIVKEIQVFEEKYKNRKIS